jgi:hypothetical protein
MANVLDAQPGDVAIGRRVEVVFERASDEMALPQFRLLAA